MFNDEVLDIDKNIYRLKTAVLYMFKLSRKDLHSLRKTQKRPQTMIRFCIEKKGMYSRLQTDLYGWRMYQNCSL